MARIRLSRDMKWLVVIAIVLISGWYLLLHVGELSKEEVRILLREVRLPEALNPDAMYAYYVLDDSFTLTMCIRVKEAQADELLDTWLQEASRVSMDDATLSIGTPWPHHICNGRSILVVQEGDVMVSQQLGVDEFEHLRFLLRRRDAGVDIHCFFRTHRHSVPKEMLAQPSHFGVNL